MKFATPLFFRLKMPTKSIRWLMLVGFMLLAACSTGGAGDPAKIVEQYLQAKIAGDEAAMRGLLCSTMEADLVREASSFAGLGAKLEDMTCSRNGDTNTVTCTGAIVATYGSEERDFPLASFAVVEEEGAWKWCGEAP